MILKQFPNIGYLEHRFLDEELSFLREEVDEIKNNFDSSIPANDGLAGNLEREFLLSKSHNQLEFLLFPYLISFTREHNLFVTINYTTHDVPLTLASSWVNFQKKGEFNPVHSHNGVVSFVLYLDVPYDIKDEMNLPSSRNSATNVPAHFSFFYTTTLGKIGISNIPVDKTYRNVLLMFPAKLSHSVYPFYTSDDYRISVSGNFSLNTANAASI
jgi:hypothetical protein